MIFYARNFKYCQLLTVLILSLSAKASELDTKQVCADEKHVSYLQIMFKNFVKNICSQNIPLCSVPEDSFWETIFEFVGTKYRAIKTIRVRKRLNALSACGTNQLATAHGRTIDIFDLGTLSKIKTLTNSRTWISWILGIDKNIYSLATLPDGKFASGGDGRIKIWNTLSGRCVKAWEIISGPTSALTIHNNKIIAGDRNGNICFWGSNDDTFSAFGAYEHAPILPDRLRQVFKFWLLIDDEDPDYLRTDITALSINPSSGLLVSIASGTVKEWNLDNLNDQDEPIPLLESSVPKLKTMIYLSHNTRVDGFKNGTIKIGTYGPNTNKQIMQICNAGNSIVSLALLPNNMFASGAADGTVKLWKSGPDYNYSSKKPIIEKNKASSCKVCLHRCFTRILNCSKLLKSYATFFKKNN